jgi:hypothetical protein
MCTIDACERLCCKQNIVLRGSDINIRIIYINEKLYRFYHFKALLEINLLLILCECNYDLILSILRF